MRSKGMMAAFVVVLLWGLLYPLVKFGYQVMGLEGAGNLLLFTAFRFLFCGGVITVFTAIRQPGEFKTLKNGWVAVLLVGLFAVGLHYGFTSVGLRLTESSKTAILKQIGTVLYVCFAGFFFPADKLTVRKLAGLLLGVLGIVVINADGGALHFGLGEILILTASLCSVCANIISKKISQKVTPIVLTGVSQLFGGAILLCIGLCSGGKVTEALPNAWDGALVFGGIVAASVISYCLWYLTVQKENLSKLFIIRFSEPLFAAVMSWMMLGENIFKWEYGIAFLLISGGILVVNMKKKEKAV